MCKINLYQTITEEARNGAHYVYICGDVQYAYVNVYWIDIFLYFIHKCPERVHFLVLRQYIQWPYLLGLG